MRTSRLVMTGVFTLAMVLTAGVGIYTFNKADTFAADCSDNSIVRCGFTSYEGLTAAYNNNDYGDIRTIFDHYWIKPTLEPGTRAVMGVADSNGNVIADGRVVANNASSIGRTPIQHSHPISIGGKTYYETSHVGGKAFAPGVTQLTALVVLDEAGNFKYAVITDCGNPIYATPVPPPAPEPKDIQVCELESKKIITIKEDQFDQAKHSKNLADCEEKEIVVCELATKTYPVTIKEDEFDAEKHSKNPEDCKEEPKEIVVCELDTKKYPVTIKEEDFDVEKHSKNPEDCKEVPVPEKIKVCDLESKTWITITKSMYDEDKHSTNQADCEVKPVTPPEEPTPPAPKPVQASTPVELPKTGMGSLMGSALGLTSMTVAAYYYAVSRRNG